MEVRKRARLSLIAFLISALLLIPAIASKKVYIVYLRGHSHGNDSTIEDFNRAADSLHELLESFLESKEKAQEAIIYSYTKHINEISDMWRAREKEHELDGKQRHISKDKITAFEKRLFQWRL